MKFLSGLLYKLVLALAGLFILVFGSYLWSLSMPEVKPLKLESRPAPLATYAEALSHFDTSLQSDKARGDLDPNCLPVLLTHGHKTGRVIVLLHGLTACPYQYVELGKLFFDQGYNVYIPRLPRHGLSARISDALSGLTAEEMLASIDPIMDLASGLGDQVSVAGFSMGGDMTAIAGQLRPGLRLAVPISPAFGLRFVPDAFSLTLARLLLGMPEFYVWWDPINREKSMGVSGYPGFSSRALGQVLRMAMAERELARKEPPAARDLLVITNWGDMGINLGATDSLAEDWQKHGGAVRRFRFPFLPWLQHDFISVDSPLANTQAAYPRLLELITAYQ